MTKKKSKDVAKFGGVDNLGTVHMDGFEHDASNVEAQSQTNLEMDKGEGEATIIRCFTFQMNLEKPELFIERRPSKQEIFNSHVNGIEAALWKDGMKLFHDVAPRITFDTKKLQYSIFVAARPRNGYLLTQAPQTLSQIAHG
jgi:hypothetical protein